MRRTGGWPAASLLVCGALAACSGEAADATVTPAGPERALAGNPEGREAGAACRAGAECRSGICQGGVCTAPRGDDGVENGDESDLDCGGSSAPPCADGRACRAPSDCTSRVCTGGACQPARGDDGVKNGDESDLDCGGSSTGAARCATDRTCSAADDCESRVCDPGRKTCSAPTATDGVKNGDESDVDCGGTVTSAPRCEAERACNVHEDCASDGCDDTRRCALARSCTQTNGGRTCGAGEVGAANAQHESCCVALPIPGRATKLDKYKVSAGRMRAFVDRVNGDVRGWYEANKAQLSEAARAQIEPYAAYLPQDRTTSPWGAHYQLGGFVYLTNRPSVAQGCFVGNAANAANGAHTYWNGDLEQEDRPFDRALLDRLPLNCAPYPIVAAFCAWDGGRLQTYEENSAAYGPAPYPWGNAPEAGGFATLGGVWQPYGPARLGAAPTACPSCDTSRANWANNYQMPAGGSPAKPWDYAYFISPPGRFPLDTGAGGHKDLGGIMMELTATTTSPEQATQYDGTVVDQMRVRWSRAGSWEGHQMNNTMWQFAFMTKYGKTGARCARD